MSFFNIDPKLKALCDKAEQKALPSFQEIDRIAQYNSEKVLSAFIKHGVSESHFTPSTGYGYGDRGREVLDEVLAEIFCCEDALIRYNFMSGTHALTVALFGVLRPGDRMDEESSFRMEGDRPGIWVQVGAGLLLCFRKEHYGYRVGHRRHGHPP